ncbi:Periplasmic binding protein (fragment) [Mesorhizobium prunaredense]|uniref:Periplasmic binding protein n=1 Tax=Mesorhizobium prunaredense TaxID=1631249 RepID=A0A1R3V0Y6_9HYPH
MAALLKRAARVFRMALGATIGVSLAFAASLPARAAEGTEVFADPSKIAAIGGSITECCRPETCRSCYRSRWRKVQLARSALPPSSPCRALLPV